MQNMLKRWAAALGAAGILVASFAPQLHALVHDHDAHSGLESHAAEGFVHLRGGELHAADTAIDAECSLCNLPSPRLATNAFNDEQLFHLHIDQGGDYALSPAHSRWPLSDLSRGPPSIS